MKKRYFIFALLALSSAVGGHLFWNSIQPVNTDIPFVNDGRDLDLQNVSNTDIFPIYPDTYICGKYETSYAFYFYQTLSTKRWLSYQRVSGFTAGGFRLEPVAGDTTGDRFPPSTDSRCKHNDRNIFLSGRSELIKAPDEFLFFVRIRQGKNYKTKSISVKLEKMVTPEGKTVLRWGTPYSKFIEIDDLDLWVYRSLKVL